MKQYEYKIHKQDGVKGKILVGIPRERVFLTQFIDNRDAIFQKMAAEERIAGYYQAEGLRVDRNRDDISEYFMDHPEKPEWLWQIDTDMEQVLDSGIRLAKWNKPIVGGLYFHRGQKHDPFVFKKLPDAEDKFGRKVRNWAPMDDVVYNFLEACNLPMRDGAISIDNPPMNPLIECDAVATGNMIIHRSVFEAMPRPWWEFRDHGTGEDLHFCDSAKFDYGIPIYCDLSTISGHYHWVPMGQAQFRTLYLSKGMNQSSYNKETALSWVSEFLGLSKDEAIIKIEGGSPHEAGNYWKRKYGDDKPEDDQALEFYLDPYVGELYLIELIHWNHTAAFHSLRNVLVPIRHQNVLEIGSGIGTVAFQLVLQKNNVVASEINPFLRDFMQYRWNWMLERLKHGEVDELFIMGDEWTREAEDEQFDSVVALDVFEHLPESALKVMLKDLNRVLKIGGKIYYHAPFDQTEYYPLHYDHSEKWEALLIEAGFVPDSALIAVKVP